MTTAAIIIAAFAATVVVSLASAIGIGWFIVHNTSDEWDDE